MLGNTYYLNSTGSRWIIQGRMQFYSLENNKKTGFEWKFILRTADCFESLGNFATVNFRRNGKREREFFNDFYRFRGLPIVAPNAEFIRGFYNIEHDAYTKLDKIIEQAGAKK